VLALGFQDDHDLMLQIGARCSAKVCSIRGAVSSKARCGASRLRRCRRVCRLRRAPARGRRRQPALAAPRARARPSLGEARIYLANCCTTGGIRGALFHLERTGPEEHYDALAIWRLVELKKSVYRLPDDDPSSSLERAPQRACGRRRPETSCSRRSKR